MMKKHKWVIWVFVAVAVILLYQYWWLPRQTTAQVNASIAARNSIVTG